MTPIRSTSPGCEPSTDRHYETVRLSFLHAQVDLARSGTTSHKDTVDADVYLVLQPLASLSLHHCLEHFVVENRRDMSVADLAFADLALGRYMVPARLMTPAAAG